MKQFSQLGNYKFFERQKGIWHSENQKAIIINIGAFSTMHENTDAIETSQNLHSNISKISPDICADVEYIIFFLEEDDQASHISLNASVSKTTSTVWVGG